MAKKDKICLGTRASPLALAQARIVQNKLEKTFPHLRVTCKKIHTTGDREATTPLHQLGGKGVFIKEIEKALLNGEIDLAVHSLKDITCTLPDALCLAAFLPTESFCDVLVSNISCQQLADLPYGSTLATGSLRRKALLKKMRSDIKAIDIRGNVNTRLKKLDEGHFDGVILSEAGLIRLGMADRITHRFDPHLFYPAPGQGVIALEVRKKNVHTKLLCQAINDSHQHFFSTMEFAFLKVLGLGCDSPVGAFSFLENGKFRLKAFVSNRAMTHFLEKEVLASADERLLKAEELGNDCLQWLCHYEE